MKVIERLKKIIKVKTLSRRLWLFMSIQLLVLIILTNVLSYYSASSAMQKGAISFSEEILNIKAKSIDNYIEQMEQYSQDVLYQPATYSILANAPLLKGESEYLERIITEILEVNGMPEMRQFMKTVISRKEIQSVALLDNEGIVWAYDNDESEKKEIQKLLDNQLIENLSAKARDAQGQQNIYLKSEKGVTSELFFIRSIYSRDNYEHIGYLIILANIDVFDEIIASSMPDNAFDVMLYDDGGILVYAGSEKPSAATEEFLNKNILWQVNQAEGKLFVRATLENAKWSVVSMQELGVLFKDIHGFRRLLIGVAAVIIVLFSIVTLLFAKDILKPVAEITKAMQKVRSGQTDVDVVVDRDDELGYMSKTFNTMVKENQILVKDIYREQITKKDAELKALQSQINPHFLFNTLETISWKARLSDVDEISEMVEDLAEIIRASIGKEQPVIELITEIKYIDKYLGIMKKRFSKRLEVKKRIDESLHSYKIPRLLIQPLIENAIYHGIDKKREGGCVFIGVESDEKYTSIIICNSGKGMPKAQVEQINNDLARSSDEYFRNIKENQNQNVGLENVNRRIMLYYGEEYGIRVESKYGHYTKVIALLPREFNHGGQESV